MSGGTMLTKVETLEHGGWVTLGVFGRTRARKMCALLRREGQIVRCEGEVVKRPRIGWLAAQEHTQLGQVDGIDIFILSYRPWNSSWALFVRLPDQQVAEPHEFSEEEAAKDAAERLLDTFIWRLGVTIR